MTRSSTADDLNLNTHTTTTSKPPIPLTNHQRRDQIIALFDEAIASIRPRPPLSTAPLSILENEGLPIFIPVFRISIPEQFRKVNFKSMDVGKTTDSHLFKRIKDNWRWQERRRSEFWDKNIWSGEVEWCSTSDVVSKLEHDPRDGKRCGEWVVEKGATQNLLAACQEANISTEKENKGGGFLC
ncbi:hypothetical protein CC80DRAFT_544360 [Byssothecium circinans]|uniref:Uncharacterized protein n=1 Tax=Byssothecium circinans TaxID=147558 RepID=A0A6A5U753_9PLEO|nr:hypothetical protein CC80DRAFT_544360 [Byssothecium circinans]